MIDEINEGTIKVLTITFTDETGEEVTPTAATYRIDDLGTGYAIRGATNITLSPSTDIMMTSSDTRIIDDSRPYETRRITFHWEYLTRASPSETGTGNAEYLVNVKNLNAVVIPSPP